MYYVNGFPNSVGELNSLFMREEKRVSLVTVIANRKRYESVTHNNPQIPAENRPGTCIKDESLFVSEAQHLSMTSCVREMH